MTAWCASCPHHVWLHEPTAACRACEVIGTLCVFTAMPADPNPMPARFHLFRRTKEHRP